MICRCGSVSSSCSVSVSPYYSDCYLYDIMTQKKPLWQYDTKEMTLVGSSGCLEMFIHGIRPLILHRRCPLRYVLHRGDALWCGLGGAEQWQVESGRKYIRGERGVLSGSDWQRRLCAKWVLSVFVIVIINYQAPTPKMSKGCHVKNVDVGNISPWEKLKPVL